MLETRWAGLGCASLSRCSSAARRCVTPACSRAALSVGGGSAKDAGGRAWSACCNCLGASARVQAGAPSGRPRARVG